MGVAGCLALLASRVHVDSESRVAFDNHGYPPNIGIQLWLDGEMRPELTSATCTIDFCETAPVRIDKGRHRIRLRVFIDGQASPFTETAVDHEP
jgi:hypothetical protein